MVETKESLLDKISNLSVINQLVETVYVDDSKGRLETVRISKKEGVVKTINDSIDFKLKTNGFITKNNLIISDLPHTKTIVGNKTLQQCISSNINKVFINEIKSFKNTQFFKFKFRKTSLISKIFRKSNNNKLIEKIINIGSDCSWVIIPSFMKDVISKSNKFISNVNSTNSLIYNFGTLGNINVYVNPDEDGLSLYFGNYDSITIIINKNIKNIELKTLSKYKGNKIELDYLFIERGITKILKLE